MASTLLTQEEQLAAFYRSFLAKRYRKSVLEALERDKKKVSKKAAASPTGASLDALGRLLDERYCQLLPKGNTWQNQAFVRQALAKYKMASCYVLSEQERYDQQYVSVRVALDEIVGVGYTSLIFFVPGQMAYLEGHSPGERYLCLREGEPSGTSIVQ